MKNRYNSKMFNKQRKILVVVGSDFKKRFEFFGRNSGLHGFNHLFRENVTLLARLFWLTVLAVSTGGLYLMVVPMIEADGLIYFAPDTRYLEWTTVFPRVTICEQTNIKYSQRTLAQLYPDLVKPLSYAHQRYLTGLLFARGTCAQTQCSPCGELVPCEVSWRNVMENVHKKCDELLSDCFYNGVQFPCCQTFLHADSEQGPCFTFNALENVKLTKKPLFTVNRTTGPGVLTFHVLSDVDVSIHSNEELATFSLSEKLKFPLRLLDGNNFELLFSVLEMENDPALFDEDKAERKCRFVDELLDEKIHTYSVYSNGACNLALNTKLSFEHCGCISPVRDLSYKNYYCNYTGMVCLTQYEVLKNKLGLEEADEELNCLPSCVESELFIKHQSQKMNPEYADSGIAVKIEMAELPTLRYQRKLLRTNLDVVVSVGGMAGLFFGASLLSIVEIFYLIIRKPIT